MASVAEGVFSGGLPIDMILIGMLVAVVVILVDVVLERRSSTFRTPVLALAVGIYLPLELSVPILAGGLLAYGAHRRRLSGQDPGVLFAAGLITGEALVGIAMAIPIVVFEEPDILAFWGAREGGLPGMILLALVAGLLYRAGSGSPARSA
jgi:putative OPT family oligopeptide transporter